MHASHQQRWSLIRLLLAVATWRCYQKLCAPAGHAQCLTYAALSAASLLCSSLPRLPGSNLLFGLPVVMDTTDESVKEGSRVLLTYKGQNLAVLDVESKWAPNKVCANFCVTRLAGGENGNVEQIWAVAACKAGKAGGGRCLTRLVHAQANIRETPAPLRRPGQLIAMAAPHYTGLLLRASAAAAGPYLSHVALVSDGRSADMWCCRSRRRSSATRRQHLNTQAGGGRLK